MKKAQATRLASGQKGPTHPRVWEYFDALVAKDFKAAEAHEDFLKRKSGHYDVGKPDPTVQTLVWQSVNETIGAYLAHRDWSPKYRDRFGRDIINSIPRGSIYFGGTDPGRFLITFYSTSHEVGDPFFTIAQNQLANFQYLEYIRDLYSASINTPWVMDSQRAFESYMKDAQARLVAGKLRRGEIAKTVDGKLSISGQVAVMSINALLCKTIFEKNPDLEFYIEESFPLDWMFPHLTPHKLIMKINRKPVARITDATVARDHEFWSKYASGMIGDWLKYDTSVGEVVTFSRNTYLDRNYANFTGDTQFVRDKHAQKAFSKLRCAIAGLYFWRVSEAARRFDAVRF